MSQMTEQQQLAMSKVIAEVIQERQRQHAKWGEQNLESFELSQPLYSQREKLRARRHWNDEHNSDGKPLTFKAILEEEFLEVICERDPARLRAELLQVAAVAIQWVEKLDREAKP